MSALNALAAGDFQALMDGLFSDDRVEGDVPCRCDQPNRVIAVRTGCVVVMYINMAETHGVDSPEPLDVVSYRSVAQAMIVMDGLRAQMEQINGAQQLLAALNGTATPQGWQSVPGDFMVI